MVHAHTWDKIASIKPMGMETPQILKIVKVGLELILKKVKKE